MVTLPANLASAPLDISRETRLSSVVIAFLAVFRKSARVDGKGSYVRVMQSDAGPIASLRRRLFIEAEIENHPLFASLLGNAFDREAEQRIALEIFYVLNAFPRFLSAVVTQIEDWRTCQDLVENLFERGHMRPIAVHVMTYRSLLRALGTSDAQIDRYEPALPALCYVRAMLDLCARQPIAEGIGALAVIEEIVARVSPIAACLGTMRSSGRAIGAHFSARDAGDRSRGGVLYEVGARLGGRAIPGVMRGMQLGIYYQVRLYSDLLRERRAAAGDPLSRAAQLTE